MSKCIVYNYYSCYYKLLKSLKKKMCNPSLSCRKQIAALNPVIRVADASFQSRVFSCYYCPDTMYATQCVSDLIIDRFVIMTERQVRSSTKQQLATDKKPVSDSSLIGIIFCQACQTHFVRSQTIGSFF